MSSTTVAAIGNGRHEATGPRGVGLTTASPACSRGRCCELHAFPEGCVPAEPTFVPAAGADPKSDEGWVMTYVYDANRDASDFVILDASRMSAEPVARVKLPQRVPYGFHGSWIADPA